MKKIRYAIVGAGWISQEAFMPAVEQTGNSTIAAIVTGDREKADRLAVFHGVPQVVGYDGYDALMASGTVDAVYIALPNSMHADYTIRAAKAGVHTLVEKPLATTVAECEAMIASAQANKVHLMTAYRLHNEPATLEAYEMIRRGDVGDPRLFSSLFTFPLPAGNHRLKAEFWGGPLQDIGVYCLNAARHAFSAEPIEAVAITGTRDGDVRFAEVEEAISTTLRFPGGRLAHFTVSFGAEPVETWRVIGTKGDITMEPAYRFDTTRRIRLVQGSEVTERAYPQMENFSGMIAYFSECVLNGTEPEPDGADGLADVRAMRAIEQAALTGTAQKIDSGARTRFTSPDMARPFRPVWKRLLV